MASTYPVRLGSQGRLVIPAELREELAAEEGVVYEASIEDGALVLRSREQLRNEALTALRRRWSEAAGDRSLVDELIAERRSEARREAEGR